MDKKSINRILIVTKKRVSDFFATLKTNNDSKKIISVVIATVIIIAVMLCVAIASCSSDKKIDNKEGNTVSTEASTLESVTSGSLSVKDKTSGDNMYKVNLPPEDELNVRLAPSSATDESKVITAIPGNTVIQVQFVYNNWGFVEYSDYAGWVSMEYLTPNK